MINSYSKIYALGHKAVESLFLEPVTVEEKLDGSQFSFCLRENGLHMRSKGAIILPHEPPKLFKKAVDYVNHLFLGDRLPLNHVFRCEAITSKRHNTLTYDNPPACGMILFDVDTGDQCYQSPLVRAQIGELLGIPVVPILFQGVVSDINTLKDFLKLESFMGGAKIEGFVVKNYSRFDVDKKVLMGKFVSEQFKEAHSERTGTFQGPSKKDVVLAIAEHFCTQARWKKAIQRLRDDNKLYNDPRDIGPLLKSISKDVLEECTDEIKDALFKWFWKDLAKAATKGFPEWYKTQLLEQQPVATRVHDEVTVDYTKMKSDDDGTLSLGCRLAD